MFNPKLVAHSVNTILAGSLLLASASQAASPHAQGHILVKPAAGLSERAFDKILKGAGAKAKGKLRGLNVRVVEVPPQAEARIALALNRKKGIAFAEVDRLLEPVADPNDPHFSSQWHLPKMQAPEAWQFGDGAGVTVAVCDTGVYSGHADLAGRVLPGWNTVSNNTDSSDIQGHGTKVAGTIAAATNNLLGVASTAPGAKILPVRVSNSSDGSAYYSDIAECIRWAADNGARVANASYMAAGSSTVDSAASYMVSKGGVVTISAGNYNSDPGYANSPYIFGVAATDSNDNKSSFSSYGSYVDITAPGSGIYTTNRSGTYSSVSGTSFSSPNTAAVAALVMSANPSLNANDVMAVIVQTAQDLGTSGWDPYFGHGRVNARAAAELAANAETSDTTAPDTSVLNPAGGSNVSGDVAVDIRATDNFGVTAVELLVNGQTVARETQGVDGLYEFGWDSTTVQDGQHRISAVAYDAAGNVGSAQSVTVNVANVADDSAPVVTITEPTGGTYDRRVTISAFATDDQSSITRLDILGDGKLLCSGTSSASCSWNLRKVSDGVHTVTAKAFDAAGNQGSSSVSFTKGSTSTDSDNTNPNKGKGRNK